MTASASASTRSPSRCAGKITTSASRGIRRHERFLDHRDLAAARRFPLAPQQGRHRSEWLGSSTAPTLSEIPRNDGACGLGGPGSLQQPGRAARMPEACHPARLEATLRRRGIDNAGYGTTSSMISRPAIGNHPALATLSRFDCCHGQDSSRSSIVRKPGADGQIRRVPGGDVRERCGVLVTQERGVGHREDAPPLVEAQVASVGGSAIDAEPVEDLLELLVVLVVGRVKVLCLRDELQGVITFQAISK